MNPTPILSFPDNFSIEVLNILKSKTSLSKNGCLEWTGPLDRNGYGKFSIKKSVFGKRRMTGAHRASWIAHNGTIPDELLQIDHLCFNRRCVNIGHLDLVTEEENRRRAAVHYDGNGGRVGYESLEMHRCRTHGRSDGYLKLRNDGYFFWACRHCQRAGSARYRQRNRKPKTVRLCTIDGCGRKHKARGYCTKHYQQDRNRLSS